MKTLDFNVAITVTNAQDDFEIMKNLQGLLFDFQAFDAGKKIHTINVQRWRMKEAGNDRF